jgi:predicted RNase H-like HicB family nuclease
MIRYPVMIEQGTATRAYGVAVPDLHGCFSAGNTLDEALDEARDAIALWIDLALDEGRQVPGPSSVEAVRQLPDYAGWVPAIVEIDDAVIDDTIERVNITLPRRVLRRLDELARQSGQSRGGFIAMLTRHLAGTDESHRV